ncbi:biliverdin-producing heme oxygenase [Candidatus Woesearchaeota archaeon]|nr:biliverdin-producing heme oxygenase [Candidatus Woesearchaeota archaeon]
MVDRGLGFFAGYGPETASLWQRFRTSLAVADLEQARVVATACQTFDSLEQWFDALDFNPPARAGSGPDR